MPIQPKIRAALGLRQQVPAAPVMPVNQNGVTPAMTGLFGRMTQQANQASAGLPGFNYVPPRVGPPPVPIAAPGAPGVPLGSTPEELRAFMGRGGGRYAPPQGVLAPHGGGSAAFIANNRMRR